MISVPLLRRPARNYGDNRGLVGISSRAFVGRFYSQFHFDKRASAP